PSSPRWSRSTPPSSTSSASTRQACAGASAPRLTPRSPAIRSTSPSWPASRRSSPPTPGDRAAKSPSATRRSSGTGLSNLSGRRRLERQGTEVVALAYVDAVVAQDGVRRRHVEVEVRVRVLHQVFAPLHGLALAAGHRDHLVLGAGEVVGLVAVEDPQGRLDAGAQLIDRLLGVGLRGCLLAGEADEGELGVV